MALQFAMSWASRSRRALARDFCSAKARPELCVLHLAAPSLPLVEQLAVEEALLRADARNWCVVGHGAAGPPTVVLGVAGRADRLVHGELCRARGVPVLRRFTGGGTVVVDAGTLFVSLVANKLDVPARAGGAPPPLFPREVMRWSADEVYAPVFARAFGAPGFALREHDYCWEDRKVGGNAQSVSRDRWLHHTSFLWDFDPRNMELLTMPEKRPEYRRDRAHTDFLVPLSSIRRPQPGSAGAAPAPAPTRDDFVRALFDRLREDWDVREATLADALEVAARPQALERRSNVFVEV